MHGESGRTVAAKVGAMSSKNSVLSMVFGLIRSAISQREPLVVMVSSREGRLRMSARRAEQAEVVIAAVQEMDDAKSRQQARDSRADRPACDPAEDPEDLW
jgi:hypothetical protein